MHYSSVPPPSVFMAAWYFTAGDPGKTIGRDRNATSRQTRQAGTVLPTKKWIWLADDDVDDRDLFAEAMGRMDPAVKLQMLENGRTLMQQLHAAAALPDLVFLDLNMPGKNGIDCLQEIRQSEKLQHIPVIIYSTSSSLKDIDDSFEKGANLYVRKPNSFKDLVVLSERILSLNWDLYQPNTSRTRYVFTLK